MRVDLVDGTYELFRQFFGQPPRQNDNGQEIAAARGVVMSVAAMLSDGATHVAVATDHVIESFRNELWPGYKTGQGIDPDLLGQFGLLEDALMALGVTVWPMVELEADDALGSAAAVAGADANVDRVTIWTPDKDLAQSVIGERVVQFDRRRETVIDEAGVVAKFGVEPTSIPDWLALVGDSADGFPGISGWGQKSASAVLFHYRHLEAIPDDDGSWDPELVSRVRSAKRLAAQLAADRELAELFKVIATLRIEPEVVGTTASWRWRQPTREFAGVCSMLGLGRLPQQMDALAATRA